MSRTRKSLIALLVAFIAFAMSMFVLTTFKANATADNSFYMNGAGVRYASNEDDDTGIRFEARVGGDLYDSVIADSNKIFGAFILPNDYLTDNNISSITNHKEQFGSTIAYNECENLIKYEDNEDGTKSIVYSITDIQYGNYNRDFFCLMYIKSLDSGEYDYADANDKNIRNVADVALAAYEAGDYDAEIDEQVETLYNYAFIAEYELTDAEGSFDDAKAYASENFNAVSSFNDKVATLHNNYAAKSTIEEIKTAYAGLSSAAKEFVADEYATVVEMEENLNGSDRVFGEYGLSDAFSKYTTTSSYNMYRGKVESSVSSDYSTYVGQNGYVYDGVYGNLAKISISQGTSGIDNNGTPVPEDNHWGLVVKFNEILTAMNATGAENVTLNLYVNSTVDRRACFGLWSSSITNLSQCKYYAPGWNAITFTKADIEYIVNNYSTTMLYNTSEKFTVEGESTFELWVSDFFLQVKYADGKVFGNNGLSSAVSKYTTTSSYNMYRGKVESSVSSDYSTYVGQNGYVYDGVYGNLAKISISQGTSGIDNNGTPVSEDNNWGLVVKFNDVLTAMDATGAENVTLNLYVNSTVDRRACFGLWSSSITNLSQCKYYAPGWNAITFTKADIEYIVNNYSTTMLYNTSEKFTVEGESTFELWMSDFFLNY